MQQHSRPGHVPELIFHDLLRPWPYPYYEQLRERSPLVRARLPSGDMAWVVLGFDEAQAVLKDARFAKDFRRRQSSSALMKRLVKRRPFSTLNQNMLRLDPPDHTRLRALVAKAFTPRRVEALAPGIQLHANALIDAVEGQGRMELIDDYAFRLPVIVIAELLGIPLEDCDRLGAWSKVLIWFLGEATMRANSSLGGMLKLMWRLRARRGRERSDLEAMNAFLAYLEGLIAQRSREPRDDLISALIEAREQSDRLSQDELLAMIVLLFVAGHETTVHLIGNGTLALLRHPEQLALLRGDPSLIKAAIEEFLRYSPPVIMVPRFACQDLEIGGTLIRKDEGVMVALAAANHDPRYVEQPDVLDITRSQSQHLAFSHGIHYCVGAPLARLIGQIGINTLLQRLPGLQLAIPPEQLTWQGGRFQQGVLALPLCF